MAAPNLLRQVFKAGEADGNIVKRMARWREHAKNIRAFCTAHAATLIVIEGYSFASKGRAVLSLAEFGGVLRMALLSLGVRIVEVPPTSLKKFVCGKGNAGKTEIIAALARQYQVSYETNDEYDALGLWAMGRVILDPDYATTKNQREVVGALWTTKKKSKSQNEKDQSPK